MHKNLFFILLIIGSLCAIGFKTDAQVFIRIYSHGKKTGKGIIEYTLDSAIVITNKNNVQEQFFIREISFIKTKRSFGASIGSGSANGLIIFIKGDVHVNKQ